MACRRMCSVRSLRRVGRELGCEVFAGQRDHSPRGSIPLPPPVLRQVWLQSQPDTMDYSLRWRKWQNKMTVKWRSSRASFSSVVRWFSG